MYMPVKTVIKTDVAPEAASLVGDAKATVIARGPNNGFTLSVKQEQALWESIAQIERGDWISLEDLMATLPRRVDSAA